MNTSGDAAESVVRMSLQGIEVAAKITGVGAKNFAVLLYTVMKDKQQIKGKTKLTNMLKSGKELKVFSIKETDFKKFAQEAKRYGVLYSAVIDKKSKKSDGMVDIMVRAEDASKINRIVERFNLATVDTASIKSEIEKNKNSKEDVVKNNEEKIVDDILSKPSDKDKNKSGNPEQALAEKSPLSEPNSNTKDKLDQGTNFKKPSVKEEIKSIKEKQKDKEKLGSSNKTKDKKSKSKSKKNKKVKSRKNKNKERGR